MLVSAIWLWPAVMNTVSRVLQVPLSGWDPPGARELFFVAFDWLIYALVTPFIFAIVARWPVQRRRLAQRLAIHGAWALLFCVLWAVSGKLLDLGLMTLLSPDEVLRSISDAGPQLVRVVSVNVLGWILTTLPFGVVVYGTVAGIAHAIRYFTQARERELQVARLSEQLTGARYAALQAQLNPHFLFNTLNTITVLVRGGDREEAVQIIEQLSELLRRTLSRHRAPEVRVAEELALVAQYTAIEQARFQDRLRVQLDVAPDCRDAAVPGFAIQHLVENAIRHGIARRAEAGALSVRVRRQADDLVVEVQDDGPGIDGDITAPGHGLENTRDRLRALHGAGATLHVASLPEGGTLAVLRVPFRALRPEDPDGVA